MDHRLWFSTNSRLQNFAQRGEICKSIFLAAIPHPVVLVPVKNWYRRLSWPLERTGKKLAPEKLVFRICEVLLCFHRDKLNYFVSQRISRIIFFAVHQSRALAKSFRLVQEYLVFCDAGANKLRERFTSDWLFLGKCILNHSSEQNDKVNHAEINQEGRWRRDS